MSYYPVSEQQLPSMKSKLEGGRLGKVPTPGEALMVQVGSDKFNVGIIRKVAQGDSQRTFLVNTVVMHDNDWLLVRLDEGVALPRKKPFVPADHPVGMRYFHT